jgi:DNA-binding NarL/FixJ family response regulator
MHPRPAGYDLLVEFDQPLQVALVNECELVRVGMTAMMAEHAERVRVLPAGHPSVSADVILVDPYAHRGPGAPVGVPRPDGPTRVAVYSWETRDGYVERAMLDGASGYLSKALPGAELVAALEKVYAGERIVAVDARCLREASRSRDHGLTPRESQVIGLIAAGAPNKEIARRLGLSMNTVKTHIRTAYRTMGVTSRTRAVLWAVEHGITEHRLDAGSVDAGAA